MRNGRGASYHEFELVLGSLDRWIVAGGYKPELFPTRHVHREELCLAGFGAKLDPPLSPVFSRYWLDLVLRFDDAPRRPLVTPWPFSTHAGDGIAITPWETLQFAAEDATLELPAAGAAELHVGVEGQRDGTTLEVEHGNGPIRELQVPPSERTQYLMSALAADEAPRACVPHVVPR